MFSIFQQPWTLLITAAFLALVLIITAGFTSRKLRYRLWFLPLVIVAAALGLDRFVQTDTEKIKTLIKTVVKSAEKQDCDAISAVVSEDYSDTSHHSKNSLIAECRSRLAQPLIEKTVTRIISITPTTGSDTAVAVFTVRIVFDKKSSIYFYRPLMLVKMELNLEKSPAGKWLIRQAEILRIDTRPADWSNVR